MLCPHGIPCAQLSLVRPLPTWARILCAHWAVRCTLLTCQHPSAHPPHPHYLSCAGVGKTTALREIARMLSGGAGKRTVVVDTSNEVGGDGDIPHAGIGDARRMQVGGWGRGGECVRESVRVHVCVFGTTLSPASSQDICDV